MEDALRIIRELQDGTLDDVIRIHEDLCTVVFSTVSAYSVRNSLVHLRCRRSLIYRLGIY